MLSHVAYGPKLTGPRPFPVPPVPAPEVAELYRDHASLVARWAARFGAGMDTDDVVHEVFIVASRRLHEFRGDAKPSTWLFQITRHVMFARRRKAAVRDRLMRERVWEAELQQDAAPEENLHRRRLTAAILPALENLPAKYREALWCFEIEGLSCQEIAERAQTSVENVWVRISRARKLLKEEIDRANAARTSLDPRSTSAKLARSGLYWRHATGQDTHVPVGRVPGATVTRTSNGVRR